MIIPSVKRWLPNCLSLCICASVMLGLSTEGLARERVDDEEKEGLELYKSKILELLTDNCFECHSTKEDRFESGLDLQFRRTILEGGDRGPAIEPGEPEDSLLILAIKYEEEDLEMPPDGRLSDEEIAEFIKWIRLGAPVPDDE